MANCEIDMIQLSEMTANGEVYWCDDYFGLQNGKLLSEDDPHKSTSISHIQNTIYAQDGIAYWITYYFAVEASKDFVQAYKYDDMIMLAGYSNYTIYDENELIDLQNILRSDRVRQTSIDTITENSTYDAYFRLWRNIFSRKQDCDDVWSLAASMHSKFGKASLGMKKYVKEHRCPKCGYYCLSDESRCINCGFDMDTRKRIASGDHTQKQEVSVVKCPVCKTECYGEPLCPECGFDDLSPVFLSREEGNVWLDENVWPWRKRYWETLYDFVITDKELAEYKGNEENVFVPYGIESIGEEAFSSVSSVRNVYLPDTVRVIGEAAFFECEVRHIELPYGLERIADNAFEDAGLLSIVIPGTCREIGSDAFSGCSSLKYIEIMSGVQSIGTGAFAWCTDVMSISIPHTVTEIGDGAFPWTESLEHIAIDPRNTNYTLVKGCLIDRKNGKIVSGLSSKTLPDDQGVQRIADNAFINFETDDDVFVFPDNITEIGAAFDFARMNKVILPKHVECIDQRAFDWVCNCSFFSNQSKGSAVNSSGWSNQIRETCRVYWKGMWKKVKGNPEPILIKQKGICATLVSYEHDTENEQLFLKIRCQRKGYSNLKSVIADIEIDGACSIYTYTIDLSGDDTEKICHFRVDEGDFDDRQIYHSKEISFTLRYVDSETDQLICSTSERISLGGFGDGSHRNGDYEELPF